MAMVKIEHDEGSDTYTCAHLSILERTTEMPAQDRYEPGTHVTMSEVTSVSKERVSEEGAIDMETQNLSGITKTLHVPDDGHVIYVMDNRRNTTKILRDPNK